MILDPDSPGKFFFPFLFFLSPRKGIALKAQVDEDHRNESEEDRQNQVLEIQDVKKPHSSSYPLEKPQGPNQDQQKDRTADPQDSKEYIDFYGKFGRILHWGKVNFIPQREIAGPLLIGELAALPGPDKSHQAYPQT
jgi:hypothetical protein